MSVTENLSPNTQEPLKEQNLVHEATLRHGQEVMLDRDSLLPEDDPFNVALHQVGVRGRAVAGITAGHQRFAILDVSESLRENRGSIGIYGPFADRERIRKHTPELYELDTEHPYILIHFDDTGVMTGRAIRPEGPIRLGREAHIKDSKSSRFNYDHDDYLSRQHLEISVDDKGLYIKDENSTNGTHVRFTSQSNPTLYRTGDIKKTHAPEVQGREEPPTKEIASVPTELAPKVEIDADGRQFHMSGIIKGRREYAVLYTDIEVNGQQTTVPRLLYKSRSDGGWRVTYGIEPDGHLIKFAGYDGHYTQETKLHPKILEALDTAEITPDPEDKMYQLIYEMFSTQNKSFKENFTGRDEIKYDVNPEVERHMRVFRELTPGLLDEKHVKSLLNRYGMKSFTEYLQYLDGIFERIEGFVPDFSAQPISKTKREHTLLGQTTLEEFPAIYGGEEVIWTMATDNDGRTWVDNIRFKNTKVSSYGTSERVLDGGIITSKPLDYIKQVSGLREPDEKVEFDGEYKDITPALKHLLPIRRYRAAKARPN